MLSVHPDGPWARGCNSLTEPANLPQGEYQWGVNIVNRGGMPQTRPGFSIIPTPKGIGLPRGMTVFTPKNGVPTMVVAIGSQILTLPSPFTGTFQVLAGLSFNTSGPIVFQKAIKNVDEAADGTLTVIDAKPILMIGDGQTRTAFWDGLTARHLDPSLNETPTFKWMAYVGGRLWGASGNKLRAANLLNPLLMTEEDILSEGGSFSLPDEITGMGTTPDFANLLVCTDDTTTSFQANVTDRTQWQSIIGFQKLIFPHIGCAAGKSFASQWGITSWYSHGGLIGLDQALQTYRTTRIHYKDQDMMRSKGNMSPDISGICIGTFENYMAVSVPSGDIHNAHTWIMDQAVEDSLTDTGMPAWNGIWKGIRPVEWVTTVINGHARCFALSLDYPAVNDTVPYQANVWECFIGDRMDIGVNASRDVANKSIDCSFETKLIGQDGVFKFFRFAEIDVSQLSDVVQLKVSYAGKTGGYKLVLDKQIVASRGTIGIETININITPISEFRPQHRIVRTNSEETVLLDDTEQGVESPYTRKKSLAFSLLVEWTGRMAINAIRLYTDADTQESEGKAEEDETTDRFVQMDGIEQILQTAPSMVYDGLAKKSTYSSPIYPRWQDKYYSSLS